MKQKVENVSLGLDSDKESFSSGKLGFQVLWRKRNVGRRIKAFVEELEQMITRIKAARLRLKLLT